MPFYFTCPFCLHKTLVDESVVGQRGPCVSCGKQVAVPAPPSRRAENIAPAEQQPADIFRPKRRWLSRSTVKTAIFVAASIPVLLFGIWMLAPTILRLKARRDIVTCQQNLERIAQALNNYASDYGTYPPAVTRDANGRAMHSWRVLILPYLGEKRLYESYDLDEPWDSAVNAGLQASIPGVFVSPSNTKVGMIGESSYMLVTGPRTLFPASGPLSPRAVSDGLQNTLLVVETNNTQYPWTQPIDLDVTTLPAQIGAIGGIGGSHQGGATAVFADGRAAWLPSDTNRNIVDSLLSPSGGELVEGAWFR
jgi:prepilin-type processing-associated H-X9-DG protein